MFEESPLVDRGGPGLLESTWEIAIMLLVAGILGCLICRALGRGSRKKLEAEIDELNSNNLRLNSELDEATKSLEKSRSENHRLLTDKRRAKSDLDDFQRKHRDLQQELEQHRLGAKSTTEAPQAKEEVKLDKVEKDSLLGFASGGASSDSRNTAAASVDLDDLKKVEGIGPKIQEHLNNGGIYSYAQLAGAAVSRLQEILDAAGPAYTIHDPGTWPEQASLCRDGKWEELKNWQKELKGGKRT